MTKKIEDKEIIWENVLSSQKEWDRICGKMNEEESIWTKFTDFFLFTIPFKWNDFVYEYKMNRELFNKGYCDRDVYSYYTENARRNVKILTELKNSNIGFPSTLTEKKWNKILTDIIDGFQSILDEDDDFYTAENFRKTQKINKKRFEKGMKLYVEYYRNLWD